MARKIVAVDFDGTLCVDAFPEIGAPRNEVVTFIKMLQAQGHAIVLWTCRANDNQGIISSDKRQYLSEAVEWCTSQGIELDAVNENHPEAPYMPSPKIHYDLLVDDKNFPMHYLTKKEDGGSDAVAKGL